MSQTPTLPKYRLTISTRACCGRHRWFLLDMIEGFSHLGLHRPVLEAVSLAGKRVELRAPVMTEDAESVVDHALVDLTQALGANSLSFTGDLTMEGSGVGAAEEMDEGAKTLRERGYRVSMEVFAQ